LNGNNRHPANNKLSPKLRTQWRRNRAVIVAPDPEIGVLIRQNESPNFDFITFSYENKGPELSIIKELSPRRHYAFNSEFWGESFYKLCHLVRGSYDVVLFMNSDLLVPTSSLNTFFEINDMFALDISQPSLALNSYFSHDHTLYSPVNGLVSEIPFAEIMMPCLSGIVIEEICKLGLYTISGWGMDNYLFPYITKKLRLTPQAVVHACQVLHTKPVDSNRRVFSDGLTAHQQMERLGRLIELM